MPPRKKAVVPSKDPAPLQDTPVIFFLRTQEDIPENNVLPLEPPEGYLNLVFSTNYSEILRSIENTTTSLNSDVLKSILDKTVCESYSKDTACFWCCHTFEWSACVLPVSYDAYKNLYTCEGHFCSPECALAYLYSSVNTSDTVRWNRHNLLRYLYSPLYEKKDLSLAPPRTLLRMFGGPLDIAQYRGYVTSTNDIVNSELPPIRLVFPTMNIQGPIRDVKRYVSLSSEVVEKASQQLRLKRTKPIHANTPTLDMCIKAN